MANDDLIAGIVEEAEQLSIQQQLQLLTRLEQLLMAREFDLDVAVSRVVDEGLDINTAAAEARVSPADLVRWSARRFQSTTPTTAGSLRRADAWLAGRDERSEARLEIYRRLHEAIRTLNQMVKAATSQSPALDLVFWRVEAGLLLDELCERCLTQLPAGLVGLQAFATSEYRRVCAPCYDDLEPGWPQPYRRLARLKVVAAEHPTLFAGRLVAWQESQQHDDYEVERELQMTGVALMRLALAPMPAQDTPGAAIAALAWHVGCSPETLELLLGTLPPRVI